MTWGRALGALILLVLLMAGLSYYGAVQRQAGRAEVQAQWDQQRAQAAVAAQLESDRRWTANQETQRVATLARSRADSDARRAADFRLHDAAARYAAAAAADHPAPADAGPPAASHCAVLAELLGRVDDVAADLAQAADSARIAGEACQRAYDSLSP